MLKKFLFVTLMTLLLSATAQAQDKKGLNLFAYPRAVPESSIYNSRGLANKLTDFKGEFVVAVFWSRSCMPCVRELDDLKAFADKTSAHGIKTIIVSKESEWRNNAEQREFLKKYKADGLDFYSDPSGKLAEDFGIFASPHTVLINTKGEEIGRIRGSIDWDDKDVIEDMYKLKAQHG